MVLNIPLPADAILYDKVHFIIYSSDMIEQYSGAKNIEVNRTYRGVEKYDRVIQIETGEIKEFQSGVYIYSVKYKGETNFGKFLLIR